MMHPPVRRLALRFPLLAVLMAACAPDSGGAAEQWVVESSGPVTSIIHRGAILNGPELRAEVVARIGAVEGPEWETLGRIGAGDLDSSGNFAISDQQTYRIHVYGPDGRYRYSVGGRGGGPSEFQGINRVQFDDGVIEVWDSRRQRAARLDSGGELLSSMPAPEDRRLFALVPWRGGHVGLESVSGGVQMSDGEDFATALDSAVVVRLVNGGVEDLFRFPSLEYGRAVRNGSLTMMTLPFARRGGVAFDQNGISVVFSGSPEVLRYSPSGALERRIRLEDFGRPLDESVIESMLRSDMADADSPEVRTIVRESYSLPTPERIPAFERVFSGTDGSIVLGLHRAWERDGAQPWIFLSVDDRKSEVLWLPRGERILDVEGDQVLTARTTEEGTPLATLYRISG